MPCLAQRIMCMLGRPNGIATLDSNGILTESQRPGTSSLGGAVPIQFTNGDYPAYFETNAVGGPRSAIVIGTGTNGYMYFSDEAAQDIPTSIIPLDPAQGTPVLVGLTGNITQFMASFQVATQSNADEGINCMIHAVVCRVENDSMNLIPIMETNLDLTPELTYDDFYSDEGTVVLYPTRFATVTGLSVPVTLGDRLLILYYLTGNEESIYLSGKCCANLIIE